MNILRYADRVLQIAGSIVAPPIAGILIGRYLDELAGTRPLIMIVLLLLGLGAGIKSLVTLIIDVNRNGQE